MNVVAIIQARTGSSQLPNKNIFKIRKHMPIVPCNKQIKTI